MKKLDIYEINFCKSLKTWFENKFKPGKKGATTRLAELLNVSQGYMSRILDGKACFKSEEKRRWAAKRIGLNYEEMIGVAPTNSLAPQAVSNNIVEIEHFGVVKQFKNKPLAKEINEKLVELEFLNPDELVEIQEYIKFKIGKYDRRKKNHPDKIPLTGDRRRKKMG